MSADGGPGPSSLRVGLPSTSSSPATAKRKSMFNLVNPADPEEFSDVMQAHDQGEAVGTPQKHSATVHVGTPLAVRNLQKDSVKGILRSSGTPGSGNGVRFFPKNRFRVITPNQSLRASTEPAPSSPSSNFLSQLLSVAVPSMSMSPRRSVSQPVKPDESWEIPGQEGEVSLVASSNTSMEHSSRYDQEDEDDEGEPEEEVWTGPPEVHSSPLGLPAALDEEGEQSTQDMFVPDDMSNLMMEKMSMSGLGSFSLAQDKSQEHDSTREEDQNSMNESFPQTLRSNRVAPPTATTQNPSSGSPLARSTPDPAVTPSPLAPTPIRRASPKNTASPRTDSTPGSPCTPLRDTKPFRSIFADMSAEQADLSWPLARRSPEKSGEEAFHSIQSLESPNAPSPPASKAVTQRTPGNVTSFYDCSSATPSPMFPTRSSASSLELRTPSPFADLVNPTKAVFDAHSAHTSALSTELDMYQRLVNSLQDEVAERDSVLADLNIRALESEVWRARFEELQVEVDELRRKDSMILDKLHMAEEQTPSPTPVRIAPTPSAGDRTTIAEATSRDLEIRLAKALADAESSRATLDKVKKERDGANAQVRSLETRIADVEHDRHGQSQIHKTNDDLRAQIEAMSRRERALHAQLATAREETETAKVETEAKDHEIGRMSAEMGAGQSEVTKLRRRVDDISAELRAERDAKLVAEQRHRDVEESLSLAQKEIQILKLPKSPAHEGELARLRSQSASKDLEIAALNRRKTELKEDLEMLNIALDSKQQELELLKRRYSVRGVAGCTPLASSSRLNLSERRLNDSEMETPAPMPKGVSRPRLSSIALATPSVGPRESRRTSASVAKSTTRSSLRSVDENVPVRVPSSIRTSNSVRRTRQAVAV